MTISNPPPEHVSLSLPRSQLKPRINRLYSTHDWSWILVSCEYMFVFLLWLKSASSAGS